MLFNNRCQVPTYIIDLKSQFEVRKEKIADPLVQKNVRFHIDSTTSWRSLHFTSAENN